MDRWESLLGPLLRDVPDFPSSGVLFRDLTGVFAHGPAFRAVADRESYALEYGSATLELADGALRPGQRVLVVDDVLATGGTVAATCALVERAGAEVACVGVVVEIAGLGARELLAGRPLEALLAV